MNDKLRDWIYDNGCNTNLYDLDSAYSFASKLESNKLFLHKVTCDFIQEHLKLKHWDDDNFEFWKDKIYGWVSNYTELCGAGL